MLGQSRRSKDQLKVAETRVTSFEIGKRYTRDQVRASVGLPAMAGGDWLREWTCSHIRIIVRFAPIGDQRS